jgi:hypothetical protein
LVLSTKPVPPWSILYSLRYQFRCGRSESAIAVALPFDPPDHATAPAGLDQLKTIFERLQEGTPADFLTLSSSVLRELISEYGEGPLPEWCQPMTSMDEHRRGRHDKVREDLRQIRIFDEASWEHRGNKWVLKMADHNAANRLRRDVPDYVLSTGNVGNLVVFDAGELEAFLGEDLFSRGKPLRNLARLLGRR